MTPELKTPSCTSLYRKHHRAELHLFRLFLSPCRLLASFPIAGEHPLADPAEIFLFFISLFSL
jgi:hypothetical protein